MCTHSLSIAIYGIILVVCTVMHLTYEGFLKLVGLVYYTHSIISYHKSDFCKPECCSILHLPLS